MTKIKDFIKKYKKRLIVALIVILVAGFIAFGKGNGTDAGYTVTKTDVEQSVLLSGKVQTSDRADLGFASSGRLGRVSVENNQKVMKGAVLAQLEIGDLLADLKIKQLNSRTSTVSLESAKANLQKVTNQENTKVESARRSLLSDGLVLVPEDDDSTLTAPTISGLYRGEEGSYKIIVGKESATSQDFVIRVFGLETAKTNVNENSSTAVGTKGLYITFPGGDIDQYRDTTWLLSIPNQASSDYTANFNAYNEAQDNRDVAIKDAETRYQELLSEEGGGDSVARAEIQKIQAEIAKNTIYAPFDGRVTNIGKEVGENASVGERVISILGESKLEVVLQVSELDISKLVLGSAIKITLDAFPGETFEGLLVTVNSRDTTIEGVPVYEAFVELKSDIRIKTGMSANGTIVLDERHDVLAIPAYLITKEGNSSFVEVITAEGDKEKREITVGLAGSDSMMEVLSGLNEGDRISSDDKATK